MYCGDEELVGLLNTVSAEAIQCLHTVNCQVVMDLHSSHASPVQGKLHRHLLR